MVRLGRQCHAVVPLGAVEVEPRGVQEPRVVAQHPGVHRRQADRGLQRDLRLVVAVEEVEQQPGGRHCAQARQLAPGARQRRGRSRTPSHDRTLLILSKGAKG